MNLKNKKVMPIIVLAFLALILLLSELNMVMGANTSTTPTAVEQTTFMYLTMSGQKNGNVKGSVTTKGHENSILVLSYSHQIISPRDPASGLPTGKRQHMPFVITKPLDKSSPILYNMMTTNENIPTWELQIWTTTSTGSLTDTFNIELTNANIAVISTRGSNYGVTETISFTYQKITWTWVDGGITASDDWSAPIA